VLLIVPLASLGVASSALAAGQTINFTSTAPSPGIVGGQTYTVAATGGASGNQVTFTVDPSSSGACAISGANEVTFLAVGMCTIDANQAGGGEYTAAPQVQQAFPVRKAQSVAITSIPPSPAIAGGPTYSVTTTGGGESPNPVVVSIDPSAMSVCTVSEAVVSFIAVGTCLIDASRAGDSEYAAVQTQQPVTVSGKPQTIGFTSAAPTSAVVGGTYTPSTATSSGLLAVLTIDPASSSVCTISGPTVSFVGVGTCTINADQKGNHEYAPGHEHQSFTVFAGPVVTVVPGPTPKPPHPPPPPPPGPTLGNSNFTAGKSAFEPKTGRVIFYETITDPGTFKWMLTVPNGKFGVFASARKKCNVGLVRLKGACRPPRVIFATGSASVPAGLVIFKLRPSPNALKALKNALKRGRGMLVTATFTFQSSRGGSAVTRTQTLRVKLKK
jgi:hypothetical protein